MDNHDCERFGGLWRDDVCGKLGSGSVLQWVCPERLFKSGAEMCWKATLCTAALPPKATDGKHGLLPLSRAGQREQKVAQQGYFLTLAPGSSRPEAA